MGSGFWYHLLLRCVSGVQVLGKAPVEEAPVEEEKSCATAGLRNGMGEEGRGKEEGCRTRQQTQPWQSFQDGSPMLLSHRHDSLFSTNLLTSAEHCDGTVRHVRGSASIRINPAAWLLQDGEATRVLTTSHSTKVLDHFPRRSRLRLIASQDKSSTAMVMRATLCRQLTLVSAATSNTTHSPEEQKQPHATCMDPGSSHSGKGGIPHTSCAQEHQKQPRVIEPTPSPNFRSTNAST